MLGVSTGGRISELLSLLLLSGLIKLISDEMLFSELALRGYDLSLLRDPDETTCKIVKIG